MIQSKPMPRRAAVFGSGTMGTAIAATIASNGYGCCLWTIDPEVATHINSRRMHPRFFPGHLLPASLSSTVDLNQAFQDIGMAVIAVGADQMRPLCTMLAPYISPELTVLSVTKGLDPDTGRRMSQVIAEDTPARRVGVLSGPNITQNIVAELPTAVVIAADDETVVAMATDMIESGFLKVFGSPDVVGVEMLGALKNIVVIAAGIASELGDNARSFVISLGLAEIQELALACGALPETVLGLAGIGDLYLSSTSRYSRNHMVGTDLAKGIPLNVIIEDLKRLKETAEGINTVKSYGSIAKPLGVRMPLAECMHGILFGGRPPLETLRSFLSDKTNSMRLNHTATARK